MDQQPFFTDPWWNLRQDGPVEREQHQALHTELLTELTPGHPLHGRTFAVIAKSEASDDIIIELAAGRWARVHLTWKRAPETPPWPETEFYNTTQDLERHLHESH